jgi:hypothetical protein
MTLLKLLAAVLSIAAVPAHATVAGLAVNVPAAVVIVGLAVAVAAVRPALATVARYPSSPYPRRGTNWRWS